MLHGPGISRDRYRCMDCGIDSDAIGEFYMVKREVWATAVPTFERDGMLCIGCLEKRLGRELTPKDFTDCPLNTRDCKEMGSERLKKRMGYL